MSSNIRKHGGCSPNAASQVRFAGRWAATFGARAFRSGYDKAPSPDFQDGRYGVELYVTNLLDEQAQIFINTAQADRRITTIRPRTFGLRLSSRFD